MTESNSSKQTMAPGTVLVTKQRCPVCHRLTLQAESIIEGKDDPSNKALWYRCRCGVAFQKTPPLKTEETHKDVARIESMKESDSILIHSAKIYAPVIEELTYGRKVLDVGFGSTKNMEYLKTRGWITFGIDNNADTKETDRIIKDDFETTDRIYEKDYDCVWMSNVLERFHNPVHALSKAYRILSEDGTIFISTPDTDYLYTIPSPMWPHWKKDKNYIMWNRKSITNILEHLGFSVVLIRENVYQRFGASFNMHVIAQKVFC